MEYISTHLKLHLKSSFAFLRIDSRQFINLILHIVDWSNNRGIPTINVFQQSHMNEHVLWLESDNEVTCYRSTRWSLHLPVSVP